jgi:chemotaxis protein MotA
MTMHVLVGIVMIVGALAGVRLLDGTVIGTFGHVGTMVLVLLGPLGAAVMSHDWEALRSSIKILFEALSGRASAKRKQTLTECYEVGRLLRSGKIADAARVLEGSSDPLLQKSAPLLLQKSSGDDVAELVQTLGYQRLTEIRGAEELFGSLARSAPAFGLIGTILGLVDMLRALKDFDKLGPGMALAVMSTFFGLVLSQVLYVPLAKIIERHGQEVSVTAELLGRGLHAVSEGRALSEVRVLGAEGNGVMESHA